MIDHLGIVVSDLDVSRNFFGPSLEALGIKLLQDNAFSNGEGWLVYGNEGVYPFLVVAAGRPSFWGNGHTYSTSPIHLSFSAPSQEAVDDFYRLCLANGGKDNGVPGERPTGGHNGNYYAAYVIDPDGNNIEACMRCIK